MFKRWQPVSLVTGRWQRQRLWWRSVERRYGDSMVPRLETPSLLTPFSPRRRLVAWGCGVAGIVGAQSIVPYAHQAKGGLRSGGSLVLTTKGVTDGGRSSLSFEPASPSFQRRLDSRLQVSPCHSSESWNPGSCSEYKRSGFWPTPE